MTIEAMKQALDALYDIETTGVPVGHIDLVIDTLRTAIEDAEEQEAWKTSDTAYRPEGLPQDSMQWPLHGKSADCLREMYVLFQHCENEMRYAGWDKREADNYMRNDVYEQIVGFLK